VIRKPITYANQEKEKLVTSSHIERAIEERYYRSSLIQERVREMISKGIIKIDISGVAVGQVNGLSVLQMGISRSVSRAVLLPASAGEKGVVNVEREAEMSGPTHTKAC